MLRFCGLFFEAHSFSEYSASKSRMRDETWIGKSFKDSGRDLMEVLS
jgi:hypothetical protein